MGLSKSLGYVVTGIGLIVLILSYPSIRAFLKLTLPAQLKDSIIMIIGSAILVVGLFLAYKSSASSKQAEEVPIYEGEGKNRRIVGYKKMSK